MTISYKRKQDDFLNQTRKRVLKEVVALIILSAILFSNWASVMNLWLKVSILSAFSFYILFGLAYYPKAKRIADNYKVFLFDTALGVQLEDKINQIPFKDLKIVKVTESRGQPA